MTEETTTLKVSDIVRNFTKEDMENTYIVLDKLKKLGDEYANLEDMATPERLEEVKRMMGSYLTTLSTYYAKIKCYKSNFEYLEEERKQIKSDVIKTIVTNQALSQSAAEKIVYADPEYQNRVELLQKLKKFFWNVELKYDRYKETLRDIYQSVSQLAEERRRS